MPVFLALFMSPSTTEPTKVEGLSTDLLHAFARHITGYGWVVTLAGNFVNFVNKNDAALGFGGKAIIQRLRGGNAVAQREPCAIDAGRKGLYRKISQANEAKDVAEVNKN